MHKDGEKRSSEREYDQDRFMKRREAIRKDWADDLNTVSFDDVTHGSNDAFHWRCHTCGHEWPATMYNRLRKDGTGTNCPACSGKVITPEKSLFGRYPELRAFVVESATPDIDFSTLPPSSDKTILYRCANGHEYERSVAALVINEGRCKMCAGQAATEENNLALLYPEVAEEWHPTLNGDLKPSDVAPHSNRSVWWLCAHGHAFEQPVDKRTLRGDGCPRCWSRSSGPQNRVYAEMEWIFDEVILMAQVHGYEVDVWIPEHKLAIEIDGNYFHSDRLEADVAKTRTLGSNGINLLRLRGDDLPAIDGTIVPFGKEVTKTHIDQLLIESGLETDRIAQYRHAPVFQAEKRYRELNLLLRGVDPKKSLLALEPEIAAEWDYERNSPVRPENVSAGANVKFFFICPRCGSSYKARVDHRTGASRSGCECNRGRRFTEKVSLAAKYPDVAQYWNSEENDVAPTTVKYTEPILRSWRCPVCGGSHWAQTKSKVKGFRRYGYMPGCRSCLKVPRN